MTRPPPSPERIEDVLAVVCEGLADGVPYAVLERRHPSLPDRSTLRMWRMNNPDVDLRIKQAREDGGDMIAWRCRGVAAGDEEAGSTGDVKRDKLIVETALKLLGKWDPKRYGDRVQVDSTVTQAAPDMETMANQLLTQVASNKTLLPVLQDWCTGLLERLSKLEDDA